MAKDTSGLAPILRSVSLFGKRANDSTLELGKILKSQSITLPE